MGMEGPLAPFVDGMAERLATLGYAPTTAAGQLQLVGRFSRFLQVRGLVAGELSVAVMEEFFADLHARRGSSRPTPKALAWLVEYLDDVGIAVSAPPGVKSDEEEVVGRFGRYLVDERGLARKTVVGQERTVRLFLAEHPAGALHDLDAGDVSRFVTRQCRDLTTRSAERLVNGLRSFLRFALVEGLITAPLANAVPSVARWSVAALPRDLSRIEVTALLASCDRRRPVGRRDYAILVLLARLGLRAAEVAVLRLDDLDWRAGQIVVRGKGRTEELLPLPPDVGSAIAEYLRRSRPRRPEREVFLRVNAPLRGLTPEGVSEVVRAASERAGLGSFGAHRLRHTAGTEMLRAGASLPEVAQVLRHRSVATTAVYAKVDHLALRQLAMPWPGGQR
ncbi:MAG TPA: site-specific integrase [Egibacteraceae bacterium]|jgi:integrase/recombinase XerD|nr:site-specific integrase [Egibacteraceae bacterium]